jgi:tetraacyldisaccharide 4'-kinase
MAPLAGAYGAFARRRMNRPATYRPSVPVVCVGSFTVGGDGKTPTAIAVGRLAREQGAKPGYLTRGYRGTVTGPHLVALDGDDPGVTGDEPRLLALAAPTVISADRPGGARLLEKHGIDCIIMDDGFQNPGLGKDLAMVVVDAAAGFGNGMVTPAGPLRAPLASQWSFADVIVLVGDGAAREQVIRVAVDAGKPLLRAKLVPDEAEKWAGVTAHAFAGIGKPEKFFAALEEAGARQVGQTAFADHHVFTEGDARALLRHADAGDVRLVTTAKDHARLARAGGALAELRDRTAVFGVSLQFDDPPAARRLVQAMIDEVRNGRKVQRRSAGAA